MSYLLKYYGKKAASRMAAALSLAALLTGALWAEDAFTDGGPSLAEGNGSQGAREPQAQMLAWANAYPQHIDPPQMRDGDWAFRVKGRWFFYAGGRMLPSELRAQAESYAAQGLYSYPAAMPPWQKPSPETAERLWDATVNRGKRTLWRSSAFLDTLWGMTNKREASEQTVKVRFLGRTVVVHRDIVKQLAAVERMIDASADPAAAAWRNSLVETTGWNWRDIAASQNRSYHSYGVAVDALQPNSRRRETYWLWTWQKDLDWWDMPYSARLHPPEAVIAAFEANGFIWGGKWLFYDTMHFEYRPEILLYNGLDVNTE